MSTENITKFDFAKFSSSKMHEKGPKALSGRKEFPHTKQYGRAFYLSQDSQEIDLQTTVEVLILHGNKCANDLLFHCFKFFSQQI